MSVKHSSKSSEIPGWLFIILGVVVLAVSIVMNVINKDNTMFLFILIGVGMLGWGGMKYFIFGKKAKSDILDEEPELMSVEDRQNKINRKINDASHIKSCPKCGYALNKEDNYCYNCGEKV